VLLLGGGALLGATAETSGRRLARQTGDGGPPAVDRGAGDLAGALTVLALVWLFLPLFADVRGDLAPHPDAVQTLGRLVGARRSPQVFTDLHSAPDTGSPPGDAAFDPATLVRVRQSTVRVDSVACGRLHLGSGFAAAPDTVVTNAHVVTGSEQLRVLRPDGRRLPARVVVFDENRDGAVLHVDGLGQAPLPLADADPGSVGVAVGHPHGQAAVRMAPAVVRDEAPAIGRDIYDEDEVRRLVLFLAARLEDGDSGAPVVNGAGAVVGMAFAVAPDRRSTAYALADDEVRAVLAGVRRPAVGRCLQ
jgi:S1-C subfamily serine protease